MAHGVGERCQHKVFDRVRMEKEGMGDYRMRECRREAQHWYDHERGATPLCWQHWRLQKLDQKRRARRGRR